MSERSYKVPPVAWLKITDYMQGWTQKELGGGARIGEKRVLSLQHLPGAKDALRMETLYDMTLEDGEQMPETAMSATRRNVIVAGLELNAAVTARLYGIDAETLALYSPIECPRMSLTPLGVLRPWNNDTCFGRQQAAALLRVIREAFWQGVAEFDREFARQQEDSDYAAIDMIEAFCRDNDTSSLYADAMRREWMRQRKKHQ